MDVIAPAALAPASSGSGRPATWADLWRDLVIARARCRDDGAGVGGHATAEADPWVSRARDFDERVARRWIEPDSTRRFVLSQIDERTTALDIGAGTGAWTAMVAERARSVTAVDRSPSMLGVMRENLAARGIANVRIVEGTWPDVSVEPHDLSLCSHAMYWCDDLPAFVSRMTASTRRRCHFVLRDPSPDGIMAEASVHLRGHPLDSPNSTVAVNVLREMGLRPEVVAERGGARQPRESASLDDAVARMKRHFGLCDRDEHDGYFRALLARRLRFEGGRFIWPPDGGSMLVHWRAG